HFAAQRIWPPGDSRLGYRWMLEEGGLHLDRPHPVGSDFDHLIGAPGKPDEAIVIDVSRVSSVVDARNTLPIVAGIALRVAPERLNQPREWTFDHHDTLFASGTRGTLRGHHCGLDAGQRNTSGAWFDGQHRQAVGVSK